MVSKCRLGNGRVILSRRAALCMMMMLIFIITMIMRMIMVMRLMTTMVLMIIDHVLDNEAIDDINIEENDNYLNAPDE